MSEQRLDSEWLITNKLGGYASGTVGGMNTRTYHGILVAALKPPTDRTVIVAKVEERIGTEGHYQDLSTNQYVDVVHPDGTCYLQYFQIGNIPKWSYATDQWQLDKEITMAQGSNTSLVRYTNTGNTPLKLEVHPLLAYNNYHDTFHEDPVFDFYMEIGDDHLKTFPKHGSVPVCCGWTKGRFQRARAWYKNILLSKARKRKRDAICDYYRLGFIACELRPDESILLYFTTDGTVLQEDIKKIWDTGEKNLTGSLKKSEVDDKSALHKTEDTLPKKKDALLKKKDALPKKADTSANFYQDLLRAGEQFLVRRDTTQSTSIIAGYHWFSDWGRDTMIAMRGLTIATDRKAASESILNTFFISIDRGMIPNRFPDHHGDAIEYNAMDASLWLFVALFEYYEKFGDADFVTGKMEALNDILNHHIKGTRYNIHVTPEGFLYGGEKGVQLTWMDAIVNGQVVTPRTGCPVEINALWYNALKIHSFFRTVLGQDTQAEYSDIVTRFETHFHRCFVTETGTLFDTIMPGTSSDASLRPNQIYWLSLPFTVLDEKRQRIIFDTIKSKLFTPYGLRTLDPEDARFRPIYEGDQWQRDHAYHQGTVWPFLLYEYYRAFFNLFGASEENKRQVVHELAPLRDHFYHREGLHCISEIFDGLHPQEGKGCIQQAWSVAALVRLYTDYKLFR